MASSAEVALVVAVLLSVKFEAVNTGVLGGVLPVDGGSWRSRLERSVSFSNLFRAALKIERSRAQSDGQDGASIDRDLLRWSRALRVRPSWAGLKLFLTR